MKYLIIILSATFYLFGLNSAKAEVDSTKIEHRSLSAMPIVLYDSDTGIGFGAKSVIKDRKKLFDFTVFGSTKGEQWYAFAFKAPSPETRHGNKSIISFDSNIEYEKILKSGYFGIGNQSKDNDYQFPRESFIFQASLSYSFPKTMAGIFTTRYMHYAVYDYKADRSLISDLIPGTGENQLLVTGLSLRFDTRDSQINPKTGLRAMVSGERAIKIFGMDWNFGKTRGEFSSYHRVFGSDDIAAFRFWIQELDGLAPFQELSKIGDGWTARGYKAGRFLDRAMALTSAEYRFPIYKKLGGVSFVDVGRVWHKVSDFSFSNWHSDFGCGFRYYLANFLVRIDIGHSAEGTRIFFNFGHVF